MENKKDSKENTTSNNIPDNTEKSGKKIDKKVKKKRRKKSCNGQTEYKTFNGHKLTIREARFIDNYIETGNARQACIDAGYSTSSPGAYARELIHRSYIADEIANRLEVLEDQKIASAEEILQYFTGVMRGEIKDQFGLDAPLGERTKAAQELAKRKIDIVNKINGGKETAEVKITLNWEGLDNES